jgi:hypothetical protein
MGELLEKHNAALRAQLEGSPRKYRSPAKGSRNFTALSASGRKKAATASPSPRRVRKHRYACPGVCLRPRLTWLAPLVSTPTKKTPPHQASSSTFSRTQNDAPNPVPPVVLLALFPKRSVGQTTGSSRPNPPTPEHTLNPHSVLLPRKPSSPRLICLAQCHH